MNVINAPPGYTTPPTTPRSMGKPPPLKRKNAARTKQKKLKQLERLRKLLQQAVDTNGFAAIAALAAAPPAAAPPAAAPPAGDEA